MNCSCSRCSRRQALQIGGLGIVGLVAPTTARTVTATETEETPDVDVYQSFEIGLSDDREHVTIHCDFTLGDGHDGPVTVGVQNINDVEIETGTGVEVNGRRDSGKRFHHYSVYDGGSVTATFPVTGDDFGQTFLGVGGEWAFVAPERLVMTMTRRSVTIDFDLDLMPSTPGIVRGNHALLGEDDQYGLYEKDADEETLELVVLGDADLPTHPDDILDALTALSDSLSVGGVSDRVTIFGISDDGFPEEAPGGSSDGSNSSAWLRGSFPLDAAPSVWDHEYVHTRQTYQSIKSSVLGDDTRWLFEAEADHYATLVPYESGRASFDELEYAYERGNNDRYGDAVLADYGTWEDRRRANYTVGALVLGWLDLQIRKGSSMTHSLDDLLKEIDQIPVGETVRHDDLLALIEKYASEDVMQQADEYLTTDARPDFWGKETHEQYMSLDVSGGVIDASTDTQPEQSSEGEESERASDADSEGWAVGGFLSDLSDGAVAALVSGGVSLSTILSYEYLTNSGSDGDE